jgi:hypothetical protein
MEDKMATKMVKAGVAIAAAALAAGVAGMFGGTALGDVTTTPTGGPTINNGPRCGINAFIPVDVLGVNMGSQFACSPVASPPVGGLGL